MSVKNKKRKWEQTLVGLLIANLALLLPAILLPGGPYLFGDMDDFRSYGFGTRFIFLPVLMLLNISLLWTYLKREHPFGWRKYLSVAFIVASAVYLICYLYIMVPKADGINLVFAGAGVLLWVISLFKMRNAEYP